MSNTVTKIVERILAPKKEHRNKITATDEEIQPYIRKIWAVAADRAG